MSRPFLARVAFLLVGLTIDNTFALHSDVLSDWNEVIQSHDNPFEALNDDIEATDVTYVLHDYFNQDLDNIKKRKRSSEQELEDSQEEVVEYDPRAQFDSQKIIDAYKTYTADANHTKKVDFECICSPVKTYTIHSLIGLERHLACTTHQRYMRKKLTPLIAYNAQQYITNHADENFFQSTQTKTAYEIALKFIKNNNQGGSFFDFDEKKELKNIDLALGPIQWTCICDPTSSFAIHTKNSLLQHLKSDKHTFYRNELLKQSAQLPDDQPEAPMSPQESAMIEQATDALKKRLANEKYECPCGSCLTVERTYVLRNHFKTYKHKNNIKNVKMELKNRGVIL